jgi:hypothetical protein
LRLPGLLRREGEHILLGDFNLHHPLWSAPNGARTSRMAEDFLGTTGAAGLVLATPPGLVTWRRNDASSSTSTIDLILLSESLSRHVLLCDVQETLHHGSDHRPVATWLALPDSQQANPVKPRRLWKLGDQELVRAGSEHLTIPQHLSSPDKSMSTRSTSETSFSPWQKHLHLRQRTVKKVHPDAHGGPGKLRIGFVMSGEQEG